MCVCVCVYVTVKKAISQQMEINEGFTACYHNKFV